MSSRRAGAHTPRSTVSSEMRPSSPSLLDLFPFVEMLERGTEAAHARGAAVGKHRDPVVPEQVGHGLVAVILEVAVVGILQAFVGGFQLDEQQRDAVDEPTRSARRL